MAEKTRNHTVPEVYLKNFAQPRKKKHNIYVYNKSDGKTVQTEIGNAAVERNFYRLEAADNPLVWENFYSDHIEPLMGKAIGALIKKASPALLRSKTKIIENEDKTKLSICMIYQFVRGRAAREFMIPISKESAEKVKGQLKEKYDIDVVSRIETYLQSGLSKVAMAEASINPERMINLAQYLFSRYWVLYRIDGEAEFITSDNPVMFANNATKTALPFTNGLLSPTTVVYYPLSPKLMIAAYSLDYAGGSFEVIDNMLIVLNAAKEMSFISQINKMEMSQCKMQAFSKNKTSLDAAINCSYY